MRLPILALASLAAVFACSATVKAEKPSITPPVVPQVSVECTGWHALCSLATDCRVGPSGKADCDCWRVDENHMVVTGAIKDPAVRAATQRRCTNKNPCGVDEAPVCKAIQSREMIVDGVQTDWVSTYSYRGWCKNWKPVACDRTNGKDGPWADCMTSPCTENHSGTDRPLTCQCTVHDGGFIGTNGGCATAQDEVMSTIPRETWSFENNQFTLDMNGYEFVKGACADIGSDSIRDKLVK